MSRCPESSPRHAGVNKVNGFSTTGDRRREGVMFRALALLPFLAMLIGPFFLNRVTPFILGMPFLLAWLVAWILLTAAIMAVIFKLDPTNRIDTE
jgi:hypothetical protein